MPLIGRLLRNKQLPKHKHRRHNKPLTLKKLAKLLKLK